MKKCGFGIFLLVFGLSLMFQNCAMAIHSYSSTTYSNTTIGDEEGHDIALCPDGNIYITGSVYETSGGPNAWIAKYNSSLVLLSSASFTSSGGSIDSGSGIGCDANGNIYVTGIVSEAGQERNIWVAKYNQALVLLSSASVSGPANKGDFGNDLVIGENGYVYVTGELEITNSDADVWIGKYDSSLNLLATSTFSAPGPSLDSGESIAQDNNGNIYVAGYIYDSSIWNDNVWIGKYDSNLTLISSVTYNGSGNGADAAFGLATDAGGNVYVTGYVYESSGGYNVWIAKYNPSLSFQTSVTVGGNNIDWGSSIAVYNGDVYVTGQIYSAVSKNDIWIARYDPFLVLKSSISINSNNNADIGNSIFSDGQGTLYVTGSIDDSADEKVWISKHNLFHPGDPPGVPGSFAGIAVGVSSITWSWGNVANEDSFVVLYATGGNVSGTLSADATFWSEANLSPNTSYIRKVAAYAGVAVSTSSEATATTLAALPGIADFTNVTTNGIQVNWTANGNPPETSYTAIVSSAPFPGANSFSGNITYTTTNTFTGFNGLSAGTTYYFEVKSVNNNGISTAYVSLGSTVTRGLSYSGWGLTATEAYVSSITLISWSWSHEGFASAHTCLTPAKSAVYNIIWGWNDLSEESGYKLISSTGGNVSGNLAANTTYWIESNLSPNTRYERRVTSFNNGGESISDAVARFTLAAPPSDPALAEVNSSSITVSWSANGNPPGTSYLVEYWFVAGSAWTITQSTSPTITGLRAGATCFINVNAINGDNIPTCGAIILSTVTPYVTTPVTVVNDIVLPEEPKTVVFKPERGETRIDIPSLTFKEPVVVRVDIPANLPNVVSTGKFKNTGIGIAITLDKDVQPARDVTITISYRDSDVAGFDENKLVIARHDPDKDIWVPLDSTPDPANNLIRARTRHFSAFYVLEMSPVTAINDIKIYPNPFRPSQGHTAVTFSNLPESSTIRIYTFSGELVRELTTNASGVANWDAANRFGRNVASGVYLVFVEGAGDKKTFKVAIQR